MLTMIQSTIPQNPTWVFPSTEATAKAEFELREIDRIARRIASGLRNFAVQIGPAPIGPVYVGDTGGAIVSDKSR
jgi:hypothetical protein